jgi:2-polyprenyl-6-methoxyphenol hydroxylase-like FAD-dependent oxidoreductase
VVIVVYPLMPKAVLPHQAGGALSSIEDAEALGAFLRGATPDNVHAALQRVFRVRFKRTAQYQLKSRAEGLRAEGPPPSHLQQIQFWDYPGAVRWESERRDMVLQDGEEAVYSLSG